MANPRTLRDSDRFARERNTICADIALMDEILFAVTWALARDPSGTGQPTFEQDILAVPIDPSPDTPPLVIYYKYDDCFVDLLSIRIV
jgi:hypothetical protein